MGTPTEQLARLRRLRKEVQGIDPELVDEAVAAVPAVTDSFGGSAGVEQAIELESIVMRRERPVLAIRDNDAELVFVDEADSEIWRDRLTRAKPLIHQAAQAVGRIELKGAALDWVGTGWLVDETIIVTNRHVAAEFARRDGAGFTFKMGFDGAIAAAVDFLEEIGNPASLCFDIVRPLHIEPAPGPDVAFLEVAPTAGDNRLANRIALATRIVESASVAAIGYPAFDSRIPEPDLMERIYGRVYNKKRLAPGGITRVDDRQIMHNCTTLGGNSGSVILDLDSGEALGLHFSGRFLTANYAVRADVVAELLATLRGGARRSETPPSAPGASRTPPRPPAPPPPPPPPPGRILARLDLPLTVTISLGEVAAQTSIRATISHSSGQPDRDDDDEIADEEGRPEDYRDRRGYDREFLGTTVDLPVVERDRADVLEVDGDGSSRIELRYEHFSVVMNRRRRMCFFSAVNIDGGSSRRTKRGAWRWDPRAPRDCQIMKECYGSPPRFSRGHMSRREDPAWGSAAEAERGNGDSMHVTNVVPQMQAFNSPIWLGLEDYALGNARADAMRISVITGPIFEQDDPVMYGVRIPLSFWKIIAFRHDGTGRLCATGYLMNQEASLLPEEEFVFGQYTSPELGVTTQVPIRSIAARTGLGFGVLAAADPLGGEEEGRSTASIRLERLEDVRFA